MTAHPSYPSLRGMGPPPTDPGAPLHAVTTWSRPPGALIQDLRTRYRARVLDTQASAKVLQDEGLSDLAEAFRSEADQLAASLLEFEEMMSDLVGDLPVRKRPRGTLASRQMRSIGGMLALHIVRNRDLQDHIEAVADAEPWPTDVERWFEDQVERIDARVLACERHARPRSARHELEQGSNAATPTTVAVAIASLGLALALLGAVTAALASSLLYDAGTVPATLLGGVTGALTGLLVGAIVGGIPIAWWTRRRARLRHSPYFNDPENHDEQERTK